MQSARDWADEITVTPRGNVRLTADRRLQRMTPHELDRREKSLIDKERDYRRRSDDLEQRMLSLSRKEDEASTIMSRIVHREITSHLQQLEEHFMCALSVFPCILGGHMSYPLFRCYEVLAAPYSLNPANCGHTFCAVCILKWFFSRLHRACGGWHESVDCPICRSLLIITPETSPRLLFTFPFVPNRIAAATIESLVEKIAKPPICSQAKVKREESEGAWSSHLKRERGNTCIRKRERTEEKELESTSESVDINAWGEGGVMRAEWLKKDR